MNRLYQHLTQLLLLLLPLLLLCNGSLLFLLCPIPAYAQATTPPTPLIVGIFPRRNATETATLYKPIITYLSQNIGREVQLITAKDFNSFWEGVTKRRYDLVHYNQYHYIISRQSFGYDVILKNEEFGKATLSGALIVSQESAIQTLADLKGKKIIFGGNETAMMSYLIPTYLLQNAGLTTHDYQAEFSKNPPNAIFAVYYKQADAAGAGTELLQTETITQRIDPHKLRILAQSEEITHLPWAVKNDMPPALRIQLQQLLANLKQQPEGQALLANARLTGLQIAQDEEYNRTRAIIAELHATSP